MLNWLVTLLRAWLGISAEIKQKQAEHVGEVVQQNTDLKDALTQAQHDEKILSAPARSESSVDADLLRHADQ